jgi:3-dehydroquinate synthetase
MVAAARVSTDLTGFDQAERQNGIIGALGLPRMAPEGLEAQSVKRLMELDKKRDAAGLRMVLLQAVGVPMVRHVDATSVDGALASIGLPVASEIAPPDEDV